MKTSYGLTNTGRLSSKANEKDEGTNIQNIPKYLRTIFIPDDGDVFLDPDLAQAEAFVIVYQMKAEKLKARMNKGEKIHAVVAEWVHHKKISELTDSQYRDIKATVYGCVDKDTEVLTPTGWEKISLVSTNTPIAIWNDKNNSIKFEVPTKWNVYFYNGKMYHFRQGFFDQLLSPNHRMPHKKVRYGRARKHIDGPIIDVKASEFKLTRGNAYKLPLSGEINKTKNSVLSPDEARLLTAIQADCSIRPNGEIEGNFKKLFKIVRLYKLLKTLNIKYTILKKPNNWWYVYIKRTPRIERITKYLIGKDKTFSWKLLKDCNQEALSTIVDECCYWDGRINGITSWQYYTTNKQNAEFMMTLAHLTNKRGIIACRDNTNSNFARERAKDLYTVSISTYPLGSIRSMQIEKELYIGNIYCPTVSTGYFLIRRNKRISITGNSNYRMGIRKFARQVKKPVEQARKLMSDYFRVVPQLPAYHQWVENTIRKEREITTFYGRKRIVTGKIDSKTLYSFYAQIPQSTVADTINLALLGIWLIKPSYVKLRAQVHDELLISLPPDKVEFFKPYITYHMQTLREITIHDDILVIPVDMGKQKSNWYGK